VANASRGTASWRRPRCNSPRIRRQRREGVTRGGAIQPGPEHGGGKRFDKGGGGGKNGNGRRHRDRQQRQRPLAVIWTSEGGTTTSGGTAAASTTTGSRDMRPCCVGGGHVRAPPLAVPHPCALVCVHPCCSHFPPASSCTQAFLNLVACARRAARRAARRWRRCRYVFVLCKCPARSAAAVWSCMWCYS